MKAFFSVHQDSYDFVVIVIVIVFIGGGDGIMDLGKSQKSVNFFSVYGRPRDYSHDKRAPPPRTESSMRNSGLD